MSSKHPTNGKARPYSFIKRPPKWLTKHKEQFQYHYAHAYVWAMEQDIPGMRFGYLKEMLAEAETDPANIDYEITVDLGIDTYLFIEMMKSEVSYRKVVDAQRPPEAAQEDVRPKA